MSADLDTLLRDAAGPTTDLPDVEALWAGGRRRRRLRHLGVGASSVAAVAAVVLVAGIVGRPATTVVPVDPASPAPIEDASEVEQEGTDDAPDVTPIPPTETDEVPEVADREEPAPQDDPPPPAAEEADEAQDTTTEDASTDPAPQAAPGPTPDPAALADPCNGRGPEPSVFVDVVGPVEGQSVDGTLELVGCASVYEGTVSYRVLAAGGVLVEGFTTATAGGPELGEFRASIAVPGSGPATLEVFWEDAADGSERDLVRVAFVRQ